MEISDHQDHMALNHIESQHKLFMRVAQYDLQINIEYKAANASTEVKTNSEADISEACLSGKWEGGCQTNKDSTVTGNMIKGVIQEEMQDKTATKLCQQMKNILWMSRAQSGIPRDLRFAMNQVA